VLKEKINSFFGKAFFSKERFMEKEMTVTGAVIPGDLISRFDEIIYKIFDSHPP